MLRTHGFGDEGANDRHDLRGGAKGFGEIVIEMRTDCPFRKAPDGMAKLSSRTKTLAPLSAAAAVMASAKYLCQKEVGSRKRVGEGFVIDADDDDVFDRLGAAENEMDVLGLESDEIEEAKGSERNSGCRGGDGNGGNGEILLQTLRHEAVGLFFESYTDWKFC